MRRVVTTFLRPTTRWLTTASTTRPRHEARMSKWTESSVRQGYFVFPESFKATDKTGDKVDATETYAGFEQAKQELNRIMFERVEEDPLKDFEALVRKPLVPIAEKDNVVDEVDVMDGDEIAAEAARDGSKLQSVKIFEEDLQGNVMTESIIRVGEEEDLEPPQSVEEYRELFERLFQISDSLVVYTASDDRTMKKIERVLAGEPLDKVIEEFNREEEVIREQDMDYVKKHRKALRKEIEIGRSMEEVDKFGDEEEDVSDEHNEEDDEFIKDVLAEMEAEEVEPGKAKANLKPKKARKVKPESEKKAKIAAAVPVALMEKPLRQRNKKAFAEPNKMLAAGSEKKVKKPRTVSRSKPVVDEPQA